jgi:cytochrome d ubiquinol oxidase subunit I
MRYAPLHIGGFPDLNARRDVDDIEIPGGLSFLATHHFDALVKGLNDIPRGDWPDVPAEHLAFDVMVGIGTLLALVSMIFWGVWWRHGRETLSHRWMLWVLVLCGPLGFVALEAGWFVTELGRQPWVINGVLRTADAVTPNQNVPIFFFGFSLLYLLLTIVVVALLGHIGNLPLEMEHPHAFEPVLAGH